MASAPIDGVLKFYRVTPTGSKVLLYGNHTRALGPSGSPDGTIGSTPDSWVTIPAQTAPHKVLRVNDKLHVTFTPTGAGTTDASDATWSLPITYQDGSMDTLAGPSDSTTWDVFVLGDVALIAGREYPVCEKTVRQPFAFGGGKVFAVVENNA
jgi:hypothetical protein